MESFAQVWIIEMGEDHEGSMILGVYATRELARGDFLKYAQNLGERFGGDGFDRAESEANGSIYLHNGCDNLTLRPYGMLTQAELEA